MKNNTKNEAWAKFEKLDEQETKAIVGGGIPDPNDDVFHGCEDHMNETSLQF